ncbi:MAG: AAA family ATPase [Candidatus Wallacebacter cryptica]
MRFKAINLIAYGPFTDYRIELPEKPDFHIIYGPNEAGKSSALRALISALYGIPMRTDDNFLHDNRALRIGIDIENQSQSLSVIRQKRLKNSLLDAETEQPVDEGLLERMLANFDQTAFENLFGLDHQRLREGGQGLLEGRGDLGFSIFSAATGIERLQEVLNRLEEDSKKVFVPQRNGRGSLNEAVKDYKQARAMEEESMLRGREWQELERNYENQQEELEKLNSEIDKLEALYRKYVRIKSCTPDVIKREELRAKLEQLGDVVVLDDGFTERRQRVENRIEQADRERLKAEHKYAQLKEELDRIEVPTQLLDLSDDIKTLVERLDSYRSRLQGLPALEWNVEQLAGRALAALKSVNPDEQDLNNADSYLIPLLVSAAVKGLLADRETIINKLAEAKAGLAETQQELDGLRTEIEELGSVPEYTSLKIAIQNAQKDSKIEQSFRDNRLKQEQLIAEINSDILRLGLWRGTFEELVHLPVPAVPTVREYASQMQEYKSELKHLEEQVKQLDGELQRAEMQLARIESLGKVPTKEELDRIRSRRDLGWSLVKKSWLEGNLSREEEQEFTKGRPLAEVYEQAVRQTDAVADEMYREAHNVGQKQALLNSIHQLKTRLLELQQQGKNLLQNQEALMTKWRSEWQNTQIQPLAPEEMLRWLEERQRILAKVGDLAKLKAEAEDYLEAKRRQIAALTQAAAEVGAELGKTPSLTDVLAQAEVICQRLEEKANQLVFLRQSLASAENRSRRQIQGVQNYEAALKEIEAECRANLAKTNLPPDADFKAVAAYLERIAELEQILKEKAEQENRLAKDRELIADYENQVSELVAACAPELGDLRPDLAMQNLHQLLQQAERDRVYRNQLDKQLREQDRIINEAKVERAAAGKELAQLMESAQVKELAALKAAEQKSQEYLSLQQQIREIENRLLQEGRTLEQLVAEVKATEIDTLDSRLESLSAELERLKADKDRKLTEFGRTQAQYEKYCRGTNIQALEAREQAESLLTIVKGQGAEYLKLRAALVLLKKSLERYRDLNQGPIINLAGKIFAELTLGSFVRLKTDTDSRGNLVVVGVRETGEEVGVTGMSDGTRDQLYLALRLAAIEKHLEDNEPLPLVCDDLLINFDDARSLQTLKVLADLANKTQVVFFTHHSKIIELAHAYLPKRAVIHHLGAARPLDTLEQKTV